MGDKKEYVKLWLSYEAYFESYSDVEVGRLVRAMMRYRVSGREPGFNGNERYVWPAIRRDIDASIEAQEAAAQKNSENGKKGGRPPKAAAFPESPPNPPPIPKTEKSHDQSQGKGQEQGQGQSQGQDPDGARIREAAGFWERISGSPVPAAMYRELGLRICADSDMELIREALRLCAGKRQPAAYFAKLLQNWAAQQITSYPQYCARGYRDGKAAVPAPPAREKSFAGLAAGPEG